MKYTTIGEKLAKHSQPGPNGCLLWNGRLTDDGYGQMSHLGRTLRVHRAAWQWNHGPVPAGMLVCHHCDVRDCFAEEHLFIGTIADNNFDKDSKGRARKAVGDEHGRSKLSAAAVREIRESRLSSYEWGAALGVDPSTVRRARRGETWR